MNEVTLICDTCGCEFKKARNEYNRRIRLNKKEFFCSLSCSSKRPENVKRIKKHGGNNSAYDISKHSGKKIDEFSPFRETMKKVKQRTSKKGKTDLDLKYLKTVWDEQNGVCPFTGWKLILQTTSYTHKTSPRLASLDRIDNSKGYIKGNVRFVSVMFNFARNKFSDKDVIEFAQAITNNGDEIESNGYLFSSRTS